MGQIYQNNIQDLPKAIEAYRTILEIDPDSSATQATLELIFAEGEHQSEIASILEPLYQASRNWDALIKLADDQAERHRRHRGAAADHREHRADLREQQLGDAGQAYYWWLRAYMDDPLSERVAEEIERLAELTQEWGYIVDVGEQILENQNLSQDARVAVLSRSGQVLETRLGDRARAIEVYNRLLALVPDHAEGLQALDRLYTQTGRWEELAEILQRRIQATMDGEILVDLEMRLAAAFEQWLANPEAGDRRLQPRPSTSTATTSAPSSGSRPLYLSAARWEDLPTRRTSARRRSPTPTRTPRPAIQRMAKIAAEALGGGGDRRRSAGQGARAARRGPARAGRAGRAARALAAVGRPRRGARAAGVRGRGADREGRDLPAARPRLRRQAGQGAQQPRRVAQRPRAQRP